MKEKKNTKTTTTTKTEYTPFELTVRGTWIPFYIKRRTKEGAERLLKDHIRLRKEIGEHIGEYKIMKRTVVTTVSEWEEA